jgi:hypothetical protein
MARVRGGGLVERARTITCNDFFENNFKPLNAELNPICHFLALLGAHLILYVSGVRVNTNSLIPRTETYTLEVNATAVIKINVLGYVAV